MKRRGAFSAVILTTAALLLTACTSESSPGDSDGPVTLTFQSLSDQDGAIAATDDIVERWNAEHPDVQVKVTRAVWDSINEKLTSEFNGNAAPDIIHADAATIASFADGGYLADLTGRMSKDFQEDIAGDILESVTVDGKIIAYPTEVQTYLVFANKALLDAAGVEIPTGESMTWETFREIAKATTTAEVYGVGWGLANPTATFLSMAPQFGGTYFEGSGQDAQLRIGDGEQAVPGHVHAMAYQDQSLMPVTLTQKGSEALAAFAGGKVAMTVQGSYLAASMSSAAPGVEWIVLPPLEGSAGAGQVANPQTLSVNVDSEYVAEATEFLDYFTSTANLAALNEADALIPATTSAQEELKSKHTTNDGWDVVLASGQHLTGGTFLAATDYAAWKDAVATPAYQKYLAGQIDAETLASELTAGWDQMSK